MNSVAENDFVNASQNASIANCRPYTGPTAGPDTFILQSQIATSDEFRADFVQSVELNVEHRRVGALNITLSKIDLDGTASIVVLKDPGLGGLGDDLSRTIFEDTAERAFPGAKVVLRFFPCSNQ